MKNIKLIIFDFDGVIVDSEIEKFSFIKQELLKHKIVLRKDKMKDFVGKKTSYFLKSNFQQLSDKEIQRIVNERRRYAEENHDKIKLVSYVKIAIEKWHKKYTLAITTGSSRNLVEKLLKKHNIEKYFRVIITGQDFKNSKPNPECYLITLKKLKTRPENTLIIEDSDAGIIAGKESGCMVFALKKFYNKNIKADKTFSGYKEMMKYIE